MIQRINGSIAGIPSKPFTTKTPRQALLMPDAPAANARRQSGWGAPRTVRYVAGCYRRLVQCQTTVTRPPPIFRPVHQPFPRGIQVFQLLSPKGATQPRPTAWVTRPNPFQRVSPEGATHFNPTHIVRRNEPRTSVETSGSPPENLPPLRGSRLWHGF